MKRLFFPVLFLFLSACSGGGGADCGDYATNYEVIRVLAVAQNTCPFEASSDLIMTQNGCSVELDGLTSQVLSGTMDRFGLIQLTIDSGGTPYECVFHSPTEEFDYQIYCNNPSSNPCDILLDSSL